MRIAALGTITAICLAQPAAAQTRTVAGQFGILGEWDMTATLTKQTSEQWVGPVHLKHIGYCTTDGPEEKNGELQIRLAELRGRITGTMVIDGVACTFGGRLKDGFDGTLRCPDRRDVPITLSVE